MNIRDMADQGSACRIRHHAMVMAIGCSKTAPNFLTLAEWVPNLRLPLENACMDDECAYLPRQPNYPNLTYLA